MIYLGLHNSFQAGAALVVDGKIRGAVSEERLTRKKDHHTFPHQAISYLLDSNGLNLDDVDKFVYGMVTDVTPDQITLDKLLRRMIQGMGSSQEIKQKFYERIISETEWNKRHLDEFNKWCSENIVSSKVCFVDHHMSHAAGAYFNSPYNEALVFTCDGKGNFKSSAVFRGKDGSLDELDFHTTFDSIGYFYGTITKALGYKAERHEGKITGLAAFGNPEKFIHLTDQVLRFNSGAIQLDIGDLYLPWFVQESDLPKLFNEVEKHKREDVAAALQFSVEKTVCAWIEHCIEKYNGGEPANVCLSGGVFGNVKLNQRVRDIDSVRDVFIQPAMGDMGIPLGSVLAQASFDGKPINDFQNTMALGPSITLNDEIIRGLNEKYDVHKISNYPDQIVDIIEDNNIIGFVQGRTEYGPRALCNRSIIYHCRDKTINDWLNARLNRTEFMPFAPVTTEELASDCFIGWEAQSRAADFMTMTYDVSEEFLKLCPAAVHIDNTARPQIVRKDVNPRMHSLVKAFHERTGGLALINTSLNNHEEPIVCSLNDVLKTLDTNNVDVLVVEDYIIRPKNN